MRRKAVASLLGHSWLRNARTATQRQNTNVSSVNWQCAIRAALYLHQKQRMDGRRERE